VREFGDPEPLSEREDYNRYLSTGQLATDAQGHLYYGFTYVPEPTVRQYDRLGYAGQDIQYTAIEAFPTAQPRARRSSGKKAKGRTFLQAHPHGDRRRADEWGSLDGASEQAAPFRQGRQPAATYKIYTPEGARLEANTILVEQDHLIIGNDPLGLYEFMRPDKKNLK